MNPVESGHSIQEFGRQLILTQDLDPTYVGLVRSNLPEPQLCRWLLAYWCFYHVGAASYLSEYEGNAFWRWMERAADNTSHPPMAAHCEGRWPRAAERRHFRGQKCVDAVRFLENARPNNPEDLVRSLLPRAPDTHCTEEYMMRQVQRWPLFGPWIAFKVADMMERCYGAEVYFKPDAILMYEEPSKALSLLARGPWGKGELPQARLLLNKERDESWWYNNLLVHFDSYRAPPSGDRACGPQEVETVLCKWKSMRGGHYHVGKDIHDHRTALVGWGETAERMLRSMPGEVLA